MCVRFVNKTELISTNSANLFLWYFKHENTHRCHHNKNCSLKRQTETGPFIMDPKSYFPTVEKQPTTEKRERHAVKVPTRTEFITIHKQIVVSLKWKFHVISLSVEGRTSRIAQSEYDLHTFICPTESLAEYKSNLL